MDSRADAERLQELQILATSRRLGAERALEALMDRYGEAVFRIAWGVVGNDADADEVAQTVFWKLYTSLERYDPGRGALRTWVYTLALNAARDFARARRRRGAHRTLSLVRDVPSKRPGPPEAAACKELAAQVGRIVEELPSQQRHILVLHATEGLGPSQIAEVLATTPGNVRVQLCAARKKIAARLAPAPRAGRAPPAPRTEVALLAPAR
jgi:RNA polymerase sigma-70 factor (ECF subfamily)